MIIELTGKTLLDAVGEIREAVDFLRFYAAEARRPTESESLGVVACISPWNFPLAIFTGQIAAEFDDLLGARPVALDLQVHDEPKYRDQQGDGEDASATRYQRVVASQRRNGQPE